MAEERVQRRLAAILAADVVGYSRLTEIDEEGTLARLKLVRKELIEPAIAEHRGRTVKLMGDGALVEFASAVDAVRCAVEIQRSIAEWSVAIPVEQRIEFRIGINLGDIVIDGDDILGEGVNIAARLEGLCGPGEVYVSGTVHDQVEGKLAANFDDLGEQTVKNITKPIRVYRARDTNGEETAKTSADAGPPVSAGKPSIVVLPFENMSNDPDQEFFADGISEDIITELSRYPGLFVIARHTAFTFKGRTVKVLDIGRELGVDYVLEGSVRNVGSRVRITSQLIEAATDNHVWAERYDRELDDIFAVQDEVTRSIAATLPGRLEAADAGRVKRKPVASLAAYDHLLRGKIHHHRGTQEENALGLDAVDKALVLDPEYAEALAWKSCLLGQALFRGYLPPEGLFDSIVKNVTKAVELDNENTECHRILCEIAMVRGNLDQAVLHNDKALTLNPNDPRIVAQKGELKIWLGEPKEAVGLVEQALALDPYGQGARIHLLGYALYTLGRYEEAAKALKRIANPKLAQHAFLAACHAELGDDAAVRHHVAEILRMDLAFSIARYLETVPYRNPAHRDHYRAGLVMAGLAE